MVTTLYYTLPLSYSSTVFVSMIPVEWVKHDNMVSEVDLSILMACMYPSLIYSTILCFSAWISKLPY